MLNKTKLTTYILGLALTSACGAAPGNVGGANSNRQIAAPSMGNNMTSDTAPIDQRFRSLDEYLAHLERTQGPVDGPWYKQIRPGVYELQTGNLHLDTEGSEKRIFTREELAKKFGFAK